MSVVSTCEYNFMENNTIGEWTHISIMILWYYTHTQLQNEVFFFALFLLFLKLIPAIVAKRKTHPDDSILCVCVRVRVCANVSRNPNWKNHRKFGDTIWPKKLLITISSSTVWFYQRWTYGLIKASGKTKRGTVALRTYTLAQTLNMINRCPHFGNNMNTHTHTYYIYILASPGHLFVEFIANYNVLFSWNKMWYVEKSARYFPTFHENAAQNPQIRKLKILF